MTKSQALFKKCSKQKFLLFTTIPFIIYIFIFSYFPLYSWIWSFFDFQPGTALSSENFVGFFQYKMLFTDTSFWRAIRNTVIISVLNLGGGTLFAIAFAVFLNELTGRFFKKGVQTISYLPHFVSWVVVSSIFTGMLAGDGVVNDVLKVFGVKEPIYFLLEGQMYYGLVAISHIWKETGWAAIIYIAAMTSINSELYDAAYVDGCGRWRRIWNVTLPGIKNTIVVLLIINVGWLLNAGFDQGVLFKTGGNFLNSDVLGTYIYRYGMGKDRSYSLATAAGVVQSFTGFMLVLGTNFVCKKINGTAVF